MTINIGVGYLDSIDFLIIITTFETVSFWVTTGENRIRPSNFDIHFLGQYLMSFLGDGAKESYGNLNQVLFHLVWRW